MVFMLPGTKSLLRNITRKMSHSEVSVTEWLGNDGVCAESEIAKQSIDGVGQSVFSCFPNPGGQHTMLRRKITCICFVYNGSRIFFVCYQALIDV